MMQYGHKGPEARKPCGLFIGTSDCHSIVRRNGDRCLAFVGLVTAISVGGHTALLSEGHTPPSVMPIYSPHESASGGNENSTGDSLVRCPEGLPWRCRHRRKKTSSP